jgi:hypothetical protein
MILEVFQSLQSTPKLLQAKAPKNSNSKQEQHTEQSPKTAPLTISLLIQQTPLYDPL